MPDRTYTQDEVCKMLNEMQIKHCCELDKAISQYSTYKPKYEAAINFIKELLREE